jgi:hypothetical protein
VIYSDQDVEKGACALFLATRQGMRGLTPVARRQYLRDWRVMPEENKETWRVGVRAVLAAIEVG